MHALVMPDAVKTAFGIEADTLKVQKAKSLLLATAKQLRQKKKIDLPEPPQIYHQSLEEVGIGSCRAGCAEFCRVLAPQPAVHA